MAQMQKALSNDTVFNIVNKNFISLQDNEIKRTNIYLTQAVTALIQLMKLNNPLFAKAYKEIIFCGSFYKGTKVGKPNEFDLNIVLQLPINYNNIKLYSTQPGFTEIVIESPSSGNTSSLNILSTSEKILLDRLCWNGKLDADKFRQWIEGILHKVVTQLPKHQDKYILKVENEVKDFISLVKIKKSGPAFTAIIIIPQTNEPIHIDLAPVLSFNTYKINGTTLKLDELQIYRNKIWFAVPVPIAKTNLNRTKNLQWRFNFCHHEREILAKHGRIKPIIRQMKKLRDVQHWKKIASYYIETLFLNKLRDLQQELNRIPSTYFFYIMLIELRTACAQHRLPYFWDNNYNLLERIGRQEMMNITDRLNNIIKNIERNAMTNKYVLSQYVLTNYELQLLVQIVNNDDKENVVEENNNGQRCCIL